MYKDSDIFRSETLFYQGYPICFDIYYAKDNPSSCTLLLGGVLQDRASWKNYVKQFSKYNTVLVIDFPGVGVSGILDASFNFDFIAASINYVLEYLEITHIDIFSTSYSTLIAFEFAKNYTSKVNKLVLSSSMTYLPENQLHLIEDTLKALEENNLELFATLFYKGIRNGVNKSRNAMLVERVIGSGIKLMTKTQIQQFCENSKRVLHYNNSFNFSGKIDLNPLIFTGSLDTFTPPDLCEKVGVYFKGFQFRTIPYYDHFFHIGNSKLLFHTLIPYFTQGIIPDFEQTIREFE